MSLSSAASIAQSGLNTITAESSVLSRNITGASDTSIDSLKIANVVTTPGGCSRVASIRGYGGATKHPEAIFRSVTASKVCEKREMPIPRTHFTVNS
jgi:hypothetical protein